MSAKSADKMSPCIGIFNEIDDAKIAIHETKILDDLT